MEQNNKAYARLMELPEVQRLNLRLMELASFNEFDGPEVVLSLLNNKDLWQACLMDRESHWCASNVNERKSPLTINLINLRDMADDETKRLEKQTWNVDTLFILPQEETRTQVRLQRLAENWKADEVDWVIWPTSGRLLGGTLGRKLPLLRVWWD